jgi:anaerobic ribonucleoside-triphosphate reductase
MANHCECCKATNFSMYYFKFIKGYLCFKCNAIILEKILETMQDVESIKQYYLKEKKHE